MKPLNQMPWEIQKIVEVAIALHTTGNTPASTGERIAAAFVLNKQEYLPGHYDDMVEAWDRLDQRWQTCVKVIKRDYMHIIENS
ncbi:hypothetical protein ACFL2V_20515 [Pseudomonadota bacterium]